MDNRILIIVEKPNANFIIIDWSLSVDDGVDEDVGEDEDNRIASLVNTILNMQVIIKENPQQKIDNSM